MEVCEVWLHSLVAEVSRLWVREVQVKKQTGPKGASHDSSGPQSAGYWVGP